MSNQRSERRSRSLYGEGREERRKWREEVEEGEVGVGDLKVEGRINNIYT